VLGLQVCPTIPSSTSLTSFKIISNSSSVSTRQYLSSPPCPLLNVCFYEVAYSRHLLSVHSCYVSGLFYTACFQGSFTLYHVSVLHSFLWLILLVCILYIYFCIHLLMNTSCHCLATVNNAAIKINVQLSEPLLLCTYLELLHQMVMPCVT
jgi:hypothetical protein